MYLEHFSADCVQAQLAAEPDWSVNEHFERGYRPIVYKMKEDRPERSNFPFGRLVGEGRQGAVMPLLQTEIAADAQAYFTRSKILVESNAIEFLATWAARTGGGAVIRRLEVAVGANVEKEHKWRDRFEWIAPLFLVQIVNDGATLEVRSKLPLRRKYIDWLEYDVSGAVYDAQKSQKTQFDGLDLINAVRKLEECRRSKRMEPTNLWRFEISDDQYTRMPGDRWPFVDSMMRAIKPMGKTDQYDHVVCSYAIADIVKKPERGDFRFGFWSKYLPW